MMICLIFLEKKLWSGVCFFQFPFCTGTLVFVAYNQVSKPRTDISKKHYNKHRINSTLNTFLHLF
jgi:hypothetical protein